MKTKFYKFRRGFSSGYSRWEYVELDPKYAKDHFDELAQEYYWSEHFRGIEYHKIKMPPKEWLEERIESLKDRIKYSRETIKRYKEFLTP